MSRRSSRSILRTQSLNLGLIAGLGILGCGEAKQTSTDLDPEPNGTVGTLHVLIGNYGDHSETIYRLVKDDGEDVGLDFQGGEPRVRVGERIAVRGDRAGDRIAVKGYDLIQRRVGDTQQRLLAGAHDKRTLRVAAISLTTGMTKANLAKRVFMDPDSPAAFYRDNSYGDWTFQGDAYGPYTIDTSNCANVGRLYPMATDAQNAAKADGFDAANYDNFMYYLPTGSCGWSGIAEVGVNETRGFWNAGHSWYNNSNGCVVLAQELGHNYGLLHSHKCSAPPYQNSKSYGDTSCSDYNEYGDPNTPMGGGCGHFNSPELGAMRFISGCNTLEVTSSGTFEIGPLERKCAGPQVIRVPSGKMANRGPQYIYAEFRLGNGTLGSDSKSPRGLHFYASAEYGGNATGIMADNHDLDYAVDPFYIHAPVGNAGDSWTEPDSMVTFTLMALSQTATVQVTVPGGGSGAPQCSGGGTPPASPMCGLVTDSGTSDTGTGGTGGGPADASTDTSTGGTGGAGTGGAAGSAGTAGVGGAAGTSGAAGAGPGGAAGSAGTSGAGGTAGKGGAAGATAGTGGTTAGSAGTGTGGSAGTAGSSGSSGSAGTGGGKGGTGGTGGTGTGGSTTGGTPPSDDGCSCSIPGGNPSTRTPALLLGLLAALPALRRRRR